LIIFALPSTYNYALVDKQEQDILIIFAAPRKNKIAVGKLPTAISPQGSIQVLFMLTDFGSARNYKRILPCAVKLCAI
jgi:hypothetical protein